MEYHKNNTIELCGMPLENSNIKLNPEKQNILVKIALGKFFIENKTCNVLDENNIYSNNFNESNFTLNDMNELVKENDNDNKENNIDDGKVYIINKNGIYIYFKKVEKSFKLIKVVIKVKINSAV